MKKILVLLLPCAVAVMMAGCVFGQALTTSSVDGNTPTNKSIQSTYTVSTNHSTQTTSRTTKSHPTQATSQTPKITSTQKTSKRELHTTVSKPVETKKTTGSKKMKNNCTLFVNGKDLSAECYVHLNENCREAELPFTTIARELGAKVTRQDKTTVKIEYGGHTRVIDTSKSNFGLLRPPGATLCVRKVIDNEIIVDRTSIASLLLNWMGAKIKINYDKKIIEINN